MTVRVVEGKKPYTGGKAIEITEDKVINLRLRDENNLIIYDEGDDEIYVDLQLPDGIRPTDAFPVGVTTGRVLVADDWDVTGTLVCFKTTSGDNIKLLYGDDGKLWIDNGTGTFKRIYLKGDVDALITSLRNYVDGQLALKQDVLTAGENITIQNNVISAIGSSANGRFLSQRSCITGEPISFPASTPFEYLAGDYYLVSAIDTSATPTNYRPNGASYTGVASTTIETGDVGVGDTYVYDGTVWLLQINHNAEVSFANIAGQPADNTALSNALNDKADTTDVLTKTNTTAYTPSGDYNPATKKYVDDTVANTGVKKIDVGAVSDWTVGDDWTDVMSILDGGSAAILYDNTDLETYYLATQIEYSGTNAIITVVTGEDVYKVTLDNNNEISAIERMPGYKRFEYDLIDSTEDVTELVNHLEDGGGACIYDTNDYTINFFVSYFYKQNSTTAILYLFSVGYGSIINLRYTPTYSNNKWTLGQITNESSILMPAQVSAGKILVSDGNSSADWSRPGAYSSGTAPTSPSTGTIRWDSTNNVIKMYDGTSWVSYYPLPNPIQVVASLPANPDANTIYIVQ